MDECFLLRFSQNIDGGFQENQKHEYRHGVMAELNSGMECVSCATFGRFKNNFCPFVSICFFFWGNINEI